MFMRGFPCVLINPPKQIKKNKSHQWKAAEMVALHTSCGGQAEVNTAR